MKAAVSIVDYGSGNILSIERALHHCGVDVIHANTPELILSATKLILPGVGAFGGAMGVLEQRTLIQSLKKYVASGRPLLGICLGMQMLLDSSEESGFTEGLGLISGEVVSLPAMGLDGESYKVPNVGWSDLGVSRSIGDWESSILNKIQPGSSVYFTHSFMVKVAEKENLIADFSYGGHHISAVIKKGNITGCQFHPEKSGDIGLQILKSFVHE